MNDNDILNAGYKEYKPTPFHSDGITRCFQKRFDDEKGKKYFIDIHKWELPPHPHTGEKFPISYEFETQFNKDDKPMNITLFNRWEIEEAEQFFEDMWCAMYLDYYEEWE